MAYSELIKNSEKIRSYMRDFYVYGFKGRDAFEDKSKRVYDDESRRVKGWLEGYIDSYYDDSGKKVFLSIDSRTISRNPLYVAFRTRSFTDWDITLHFFLLDILADGPATVKQCMDRITETLPDASARELPDEGTVRNKLKEYEQMGVVTARKEGRTLVYALANDFGEKLCWQDAVDFFSETAPMGVVGSYFPTGHSSPFEFKHQYLLSALDSEIMADLCGCMNQHRGAELTIFSRRRNRERAHTIYPLRFYFSTQSGRQYILGYHYIFKKPMFFRLDGIRKVKQLGIEKNPERYEEYWEAFDQNLWGVSPGEQTLDHVRMWVHVGADELHIPERLDREKRHGSIRQIDEETWEFTADVYDASEMLPWLRTFIGRIVEFECSNAFVTQRFCEDIDAMRQLYRGGDDGAIQ